MGWRRNPLGGKAGLQFSVEKFDEILRKHYINDLSKEDRIFVTAIAEELVSILYQSIGNIAKSVNAKKIQYEHLEPYIKTLNSNIFMEVHEEVQSTSKDVIKMNSWTRRKLCQVHPELSVVGLVSCWYMDLLLDIYCEKLGDNDLNNLLGAVSNIFGNDGMLCADLLEAGKRAVDLYKQN